MVFIGRIVHVLIRTDVWRPAIIVNGPFNDAGMVNVLVFLDPANDREAAASALESTGSRATLALYSIPNEDDADDGWTGHVWRWPPKLCREWCDQNVVDHDRVACAFNEVLAKVQRYQPSRAAS